MASAPALGVSEQPSIATQRAVPNNLPQYTHGTVPFFSDAETDIVLRNAAVSGTLSPNLIQFPPPFTLPQVVLNSNNVSAIAAPAANTPATPFIQSFIIPCAQPAAAPQSGSVFQLNCFMAGVTNQTKGIVSLSGLQPANIMQLSIQCYDATPGGNAYQYGNVQIQVCAFLAAGAPPVGALAPLAANATMNLIVTLFQ